MIYSGGPSPALPDLDLLSYLFDSPLSHCTEDTPLFAEAHDPTNVLTRGDVRRITQQIAYFLRHTYGIGANGPDKDVVVTVSNGQRALACAFYAVMAAQGIYSAASPASTTSDLKRQALDGPAKVFICSADVKDVVVAAADEAGIPRRNVLVLESWPAVKLSGVDGSAVCAFDKRLQWEKITDRHALANRTACILYSSGTTGLPKGVRISHENLVSEHFLIAWVNRPIHKQWADEGNPFIRRTLGHLPAAHIAGVQGYFVNEFAEGGIVYWMPKFNFDDFVRYNAELKITFFFSVPPIYTAIAKHPAVKEQFKNMRAANAGAAPISEGIQIAAGEKCGITITQVWGLSETTGAVSATPAGRNDTVGSLSPLVPGITMRLVDEDGNDVPAGEAGEAYLKGPMITKGYHNNPEANKNAFTEDGWFKTGDILKVENSLLYMVDRKKELIKYKGLQVAPAELEGLLQSHPGIADAAVIGVPYQDDEAPKAYVVLVPPAQGKVSENEIIEWTNSKVAKHKWLRGGVQFVEAVPRSPSGKILRRELRQLVSREAKL